MANGQEEIPLRGGRTTVGVVRVGNTVRRPSTPNSSFVSRLLRHLAAKEFGGAPAPLGTDEQGRDVFAFIDGEVPTELGFHDDATLFAAASLIRRFHDFSADLVASPEAAAIGIEVICHNDLSPCNFVFRAGLPTALIDFDAAAPGSRALDLGYAAWLWLDLGSPDIAVTDQQRRLSLFLTAYGSDECESVLNAMLTRQAILVEQGRRQGDEAMAGWASECFDWTERNKKLLSQSG